MKRLIQTSACLALALSFLSLPALSQAQDNAADNAVPDLGPVFERLDQVIVGLAKLQKASGSNAKDKSLKIATKQLIDLNAAFESLASQLADQARAAGKQADSATAAAKLLKQLVALQTAAAAQDKRPAPQPKWEYKSIFGDSRVALEEEMNLFGGDGWEFFNVASFGRGTAAFARRPIK
ncbi:MAG: hypothetical protein HOH62_10245 [Verrucomicrobia bacterium]|jgi:hypothetical protein|nr:hypothetical protein [Verrucomicrobiota bacterium]MBT4227812.1 hypothetical protein [Verrucomicrobiota bacterium]MBT6104272.1 hypothetical protein [Verrucomicrobiota bacterium]